MLKKIKQWNKEYQNNTLDLKIVQESWNSWLGHINHANCYNLMKRYREKFEFQDLIN